MTIVPCNNVEEFPITPPKKFSTARKNIWTYLGINAIGVVDGAIVLDDTDAGGAGADQVAAGV